MGRYRTMAERARSNGYTSRLYPDAPMRPETKQLHGSDNLLTDQFNIKPATPINYNTAGIDRYRSEALRDPSQASPWAMEMRRLQGLEQDQSLDNAVQGLANANTAANEQMMLTGGLTGGSRERMAQNTNRDQMFARQNVFRQGAMDRANIGLKDEENRMRMLENLPGMENEALQQANLDRGFDFQRQQYNINNALGYWDNQNKDALDMYKSDMAAWGAGKTADAQAKAAKEMGKDNGFLSNPIKHIGDGLKSISPINALTKNIKLPKLKMPKIKLW